MNNFSLSHWLNLSENDRLQIFEETASKKGLSSAVVEKDWWVVNTLAVVFSLEYSQFLIFKGGTSLSKGWNLIQRFSEDIDLALDREFLGFKGELTKSNIRKLRKSSFKFISETVTEDIKNMFAKLGFENVGVKYRKVENHDQDPLIIEITYPTITVKNIYLKPNVIVEIGSRSLKEPITKRTFGTFIGEVFPENAFSYNEITIPIVNPERTLLEKIFLLHEEFQKPEGKIRVERLSRHLYDIEKLSHTKFAETALSNSKLYYTIVKHREKFTPISGINYENHKPKNIRFIPPNTILKEWEIDYNLMRETMIYANSLHFDELIKSLTLFQNQINALAF